MESPAKGSASLPSDVQRLASLVEGISFAMLTTRHEDGQSLRSRPMTMQKAAFDGSFWFFAARNTSVSEDIQSDPRVNISFADPDSQRFVSATGMAEISLDRAKMKELWSPAYQAWFERGLDDPQLCLLRVHVESADYWETPATRVVQMVGFAQSEISGKNDPEKLATRGHIDLGSPWH